MTHVGSLESTRRIRMQLWLLEHSPNFPSALQLGDTEGQVNCSTTLSIKRNEQRPSLAPRKFLWRSEIYIVLVVNGQQSRLRTLRASPYEPDNRSGWHEFCCLFIQQISARSIRIKSKKHNQNGGT